MNTLMAQLVQASYTNGKLDKTNVEKIGAKLSRKLLKEYIKALKTEEKKTTIIVEVPSAKAKPDEASLRKIFNNKKVNYVENPELLLGLRIIDNDTVYNMNLESTLERIAAYAAE